MPRGKTQPIFLAAWVAGFAVVGCTPAPEPVRLTTNPAAVAPSAPAASVSFQGRQIAGAESALPKLDERSVASHLDAGRVADALEKLSIEQKEELEGLATRLYEKKLEVLHTKRAEELTAATASYSRDKEKAWDAISAAFHAQADAMGRDRVLLASLVGFPDPDPLSRRKARRADLAGQVDLEKAARTRKSILAREEEFWSKVEAISMPVRSAFVDKLRQIASKYTEADARAMTDARAEAAEILSGATSDIETPSVDFGVFVPATPAQEVKLAPMGVDKAPVAARPSAAGSTDPAVDVFLKLKNYRLAKPGETARDVSKEFETWSRQFNAAR